METGDEFSELVEKIEEKKLDTVNVLVDMADVTAKCKKVVSSVNDSICLIVTQPFDSATATTPRRYRIMKRSHLLTR